MPKAIYWLPIFIGELIFWFRLFQRWKPRWYKRIVNNIHLGFRIVAMSVFIGVIIFISFKNLLFLKVIGSLIITWGFMLARMVGANS